VMSSARPSPRVFALSFAILVGALSGASFAPAALGQVAPARSEQSDQVCPSRADPWARTELFFGSSKPDGTAVTEAEFTRFLDEEITPRFPEGLTLLTGLGQFRGSSGVIVRERSMLLILLYPRTAATSSSVKIEEIRDLYERRFQQESVLRADDRVPVCVSF
jgi:Protein of unknown function (DUF3574)